MDECTNSTQRLCISYRRNRDYTKSIEWTEQLKRDLYECYLQSEADKPRFMQRLKTIWDEKHRDMNYISAKNLNERAKRMIRNKENYQSFDQIRK